MYILFVLMLSFSPVPAIAQDASFLGGPQGSNSSSSPSAETLNILQPANPQLLQSANAGEGGIGMPANNQTIQQTQNSNEIKVFLEGEGDSAGSQPETEDSGESLPYWVLVIPGLLALTLWLNRRRSTG